MVRIAAAKAGSFVRCSCDWPKKVNRDFCSGHFDYLHFRQGRLAIGA